MHPYTADLEQPYRGGWNKALTDSTGEQKSNRSNRSTPRGNPSETTTWKGRNKIQRKPRQA
jgi:hypothetical protein